MKKHLLLFVFILSVVFAKAQHYTQGIAVDTVIYTGAYSFPGNSCPSMTFAKIELDPALYNYVSGLEFLILVDSVTFGPPPQFSPVHAGDTFLLNAVTPSYYTPASVIFYFKLKLVGTPTAAGQNFPCNLDFRQCACNCYNMYIMPSITNVAVCTVGISNHIVEADNQILKMYPNPINDNLSISGINKQTTIKLYNSFGLLVLEQNSNQDILLDTSTLADGIYTLVTSSDLDSKGASKKIVIAK